MIIDTSALVASVRCEPGHIAINHALISSVRDAIILAPVILELHRVTADPANAPDPDVDDLVASLCAQGTTVLPFDAEMAAAAVEANARFGSSNGLGGRLNLLDLMVYAAAKVRNSAILCTGMDFAATDAKIHPASRVG